MKLEELVSKEASPAIGPYCHGRKYGNHRPTKACVQVAALAGNVSLEADMIAFVEE